MGFPDHLSFLESHYLLCVVEQVLVGMESWNSPGCQHLRVLSCKSNSPIDGLLAGVADPQHL